MKPNKYTRRMDLYNRLAKLGFTTEEADKLRRIEKTLHRWAEYCCNGEIQRDEQTQIPYWHTQRGPKDFPRVKIADRERGALKRLEAIVTAVNTRLMQESKDTPDFSSKMLWFYHQTDPRGVSVYVGRKSDLRPNQELSSCYSSAGVAVAD